MPHISNEGPLAPFIYLAHWKKAPLGVGGRRLSESHPVRGDSEQTPAPSWLPARNRLEQPFAGDQCLPGPPVAAAGFCSPVQPCSDAEAVWNPLHAGRGAPPGPPLPGAGVACRSLTQGWQRQWLRRAAGGGSEASPAARPLRCARIGFSRRALTEGWLRAG